MIQGSRVGARSLSMQVKKANAMSRCHGFVGMQSRRHSRRPSVVGCMAGRVLTLHCWPCAFHVNYDDDGGVATNAIPLALQQTTTTVATCRQHLHQPSTQVHRLPAGISCAALSRRLTVGCSRQSIRRTCVPVTSPITVLSWSQLASLPSCRPLVCSLPARPCRDCWFVVFAPYTAVATATWTGLSVCARYDNGGRRRRRRRRRTCVCFVGDDDNNIDCGDYDGDNNDDVDDLTPTRCIHATQQVQRSQIDVSCSALA
jgi:hypothetical protein